MRRFVLAVVVCLAVAGTAVAGFSFAGVVGPKTAQKVAVTDVNVAASEYAFAFTDSSGNPVNSVPAGVVNFHVKNNGSIEHDFQIAGQKTQTLFPGSSQTLTVTLQGGQSYNYACTIGEHASFGMFGALAVTGQIQTTTQVITTNGTTITTTATQTQSTTAPKPVATVAGQREGVQDHPAEHREARGVLHAREGQAGEEVQDGLGAETGEARARQVRGQEHRQDRPQLRDRNRADDDPQARADGHASTSLWRRASASTCAPSRGTPLRA